MLKVLSFFSSQPNVCQRSEIKEIPNKVYFLGIFKNVFPNCCDPSSSTNADFF